eukprot:TRINITY_DN27885_c0_g2_i1.p1 TRINITY_DN27885_c0_g2~~TRINITY_DN27885_c0_g2_i1.p1  ORF type:complete len:560 (+),score=194.54 TRINITY_DN27885_c0_g2_i1:116-1681(+)
MALSGEPEIEVESGDVVRVLLQFCSEHGLTKTFSALQEETQVALNTVPSMEAFVADIRSGQWEKVLAAVTQMRLPRDKLFDLYEHVTLEMLELKEIDVARKLMRTTEALRLLAMHDAARYSRLDALASKTLYSLQDVYPPGETRESRRNAIAASLSSEVSVVQGGRLLTLLSHAVKWQKHAGLLPSGEKVDIFRGLAQKEADLVEQFPETLAKTIKFGKTTPEVAAFSPNGSRLVTGSFDGFIEVWNPETGKIRKDLEYQKDGDYMSHDRAVLALDMSHDGEMLASGCQAGTVKIWKVSTGQCMRLFNAAHSAGITSIQFTKDGSQVLTSSFDGTARVHGIKSGKIAMKEYRGHRSYVNSACFSADGNKVVTASSDGTVRMWDAKSMKCTNTISPAGVSAADPPPCLSATFIPGTDNIAVCSRAPVITVVSGRDGHIVRQIKSSDKMQSDFVSCTLSPKGAWLYCIGEDHRLYCFDTASGKMQHALQVSEKSVSGTAHHPHRNCLATWGQEGCVKLWIPQQ